MSDRSARIRLEPTTAVTIQTGRQSDEKHCFSCGRIVHASAVACPSCGAVQPGGPMLTADHGSRVQGPANAVFCYGCGIQIHAMAQACPKCGAPQRMTQTGPGKDRTTAIVLAFLLGGVGGHKFYLGSAGWGIVYLLFSWTFLPAVAAMIEGIMYLSESDASFARKYN